MPGASFSPIRIKNSSPTSPDDLGHYFQAINPESFRSLEDYNADIEIVIDTLKAVKPSDLHKPVLVPGEPEQITRSDRSQNGIPVNQNLRKLIQEVTIRADVEYLLDNNSI